MDSFKNNFDTIFYYNNQISNIKNKISENKRKEYIFKITKITKENTFNSKFLQSFIIKKQNYEEEKVDNINNINLPDFNFEGLLCSLINIKNNNSISEFHSNFLDFKNILNFHRNLRKTKIDSILKKCKSKFFRAVQDSIKKLTNDLSQINRLPQYFITNININYNKGFMNKTIFEIYHSLNLVNQEKDFFVGISKDNNNKLKSILNSTYSDLFDLYIQSNRFKEDCDIIREKEGEKFEILYRYVSKIFIKYYSLSKGNKPKNSKIRKKMNIK